MFPVKIYNGKGEFKKEISSEALTAMLWGNAREIICLFCKNKSVVFSKKAKFCSSNCQVKNLKKNKKHKYKT
jgi:hypothetical protein